VLCLSHCGFSISKAGDCATGSACRGPLQVFPHVVLCGWERGGGSHWQWAASYAAQCIVFWHVCVPKKNSKETRGRFTCHLVFVPGPFWKGSRGFQQSRGASHSHPAVLHHVALRCYANTKRLLVPVTHTCHPCYTTSAVCYLASVTLLPPSLCVTWLALSCRHGFHASPWRPWDF
jgi:hypothetical protein